MKTTFPSAQLEKKTIQELKQMCKENFIKGYSRLKKEELIKLIEKSISSKKIKSGGNKGNRIVMNPKDFIVKLYSTI